MCGRRNTRQGGGSQGLAAPPRLPQARLRPGAPSEPQVAALGSQRPHPALPASGTGVGRQFGTGLRLGICIFVLASAPAVAARGVAARGVAARGVAARGVAARAPRLHPAGASRTPAASATSLPTLAPVDGGSKLDA